MKKYLASLLLFLCAFGAFAQKMKVKDGGFKFLNGQSEVNVEFVYENQKIFNENLANEEYMKKRSAELEEKERGLGKSWEKKWMGSRGLIYEPKFLELLNRYGHDNNVHFGQELSNAPYTLIVETVWIYPGWNVAVMRQKAKVSTLLTFVETNNRENVLLQITSKKAPGKSYGGTFSNEDRIGEGYAKTGKSLGKMIRKKAF